jgi:hypothetical protein
LANKRKALESGKTSVNIGNGGDSRDGSKPTDMAPCHMNKEVKPKHHNHGHKKMNVMDNIVHVTRTASTHKRLLSGICDRRSLKLEKLNKEGMPLGKKEKLMETLSSQVKARAKGFSNEFTQTMLSLTEADEVNLDTKRGSFGQHKKVIESDKNHKTKNLLTPNSLKTSYFESARYTTANSIWKFDQMKARDLKKYVNETLSFKKRGLNWQTRDTFSFKDNS